MQGGDFGYNARRSKAGYPFCAAARQRLLLLRLRWEKVSASPPSLFFWQVTFHLLEEEER